ncbi:MAG: DUF3142 domain-containing protein [Gemmatimonadales bacterium]|nr:DUF3142 domain-containing protein [Gemmatimonadales bacterium]
MTIPEVLRFRLAGAIVAIVIQLTACRLETPSIGASHRDGQWIWSAADSSLFAEREAGDSVLGGVWVATIRPGPTGDSLQQTLALPPSTGGAGPIAAVVRIDAATHPWWAGRSDADAARQFDRRLAALLRHVDATGIHVAEIQLDYDCPMRLLPRWASVLRHLRESALAGRELWITSLVAHQRDPDFGRRLRGVVAGQIVQLFDTGNRAGTEALSELETLTARQGLPFRIGLGAFERRLPDGRSTGHLLWFDAVGRFRSWQGFRGLWVFPAGQPYTRPLEGKR